MVNTECTYTEWQDSIIQSGINSHGCFEIKDLIHMFKVKPLYVKEFDHGQYIFTFIYDNAYYCSIKFCDQFNNETEYICIKGITLQQLYDKIQVFSTIQNKKTQSSFSYEGQYFNIITDFFRTRTILLNHFSAIMGR